MTMRGITNKTSYYKGRVMTIEQKFKRIEEETALYLDGMKTAEETVNQIVMIVHNTPTTEEFFQR